MSCQLSVASCGMQRQRQRRSPVKPEEGIDLGQLNWLDIMPWQVWFKNTLLFTCSEWGEGMGTQLNWGFNTFENILGNLTKSKEGIIDKMKWNMPWTLTGNEMGDNSNYGKRVLNIEWIMKWEKWEKTENNQ